MDKGAVSAGGSLIVGLSATLVRGSRTQKTYLRSSSDRFCEESQQGGLGVRESWSLWLRLRLRLR